MTPNNSEKIAARRLWIATEITDEMADGIAEMLDGPHDEDTGLDEHFARLAIILSGISPTLRHAVRNLIEHLDGLPDSQLRITLVLLREFLDGLAECGLQNEAVAKGGLPNGI